MKGQFSLAIIAITLGLANAYSKYGRSCKDIGCLSNEACVMAEDPCRRGGDRDCGVYPTCQKVSSNAVTCATYVCPPTTVCTMQGNNPKCIDEAQAPAKSPTSQSGDYSPSAPGLYPQIPPYGQTTTRSPIHRPAGYPNGNGYQGGSIGSGYPGQTNNNPAYPSNGGASYPGYPSQGNQGGYPGYPSQGNHPQSGYPGYGGQNGYNPGGQGYNPGGQGYNPGGQGYNPGGQAYNPYANNNYGGNNPYGSKKPAQSGGSNPIYDKITDTLKNIGTKFLKDALGNLKF